MDFDRQILRERKRMNCLNCNKPIEQKRRGRKKKYCSLRCWNIKNNYGYDRVGETVRICPECNKTFITKDQHKKGRKKTYCSGCIKIHNRKYNTEYVRKRRALVRIK